MPAKEVTPKPKGAALASNAPAAPHFSPVRLSLSKLSDWFTGTVHSLQETTGTSGRFPQSPSSPKLSPLVFTVVPDLPLVLPREFALDEEGCHLTFSRAGGGG